MLTLTELLVTAITLAVAFYYFASKKNIKTNLPPGPWGFPIVGHLPFLGKNPALKFLEWKKHYGSVFYVQFGGVPTVVLNDAKSIKEAFSMDEFCGRPLLPVMVEIADRKGIAFADGPTQTEQRRFAIKTLKEFGFGKSSVEFRMQEEISKFLDSVKSKSRTFSGKPMKMNKLFRFCVINAFWDAVMGERFDESDPTLLHLLEMIDRGTNTNESIISQIMWFFPLVAQVGSFIGYNPPVQGFRTVYNYIGEQLARLKLRHVLGQPKYFTDAYFDKIAETKDQDSSFYAAANHQKESTTELFMAAIDTTTTTLDWLMIYLSRHPEVQRKLQTEIDSVVGLHDESRQTCLIDRQKMPYTEAVTQELLRLTATLPFAVFHRTMKDVEFRGYNIPKNTMVIPNIYGTHHDPEVWPQPDKFDPQRFLDDNGQLNKSTVNFMPFSFGKRSCLGEGFAKDQIFLLMTNFFRVFSIRPADNIGPSLEGKFGLVWNPHDYELVVSERYSV